MKKLLGGAILGLALLVAQSASAGPCGLCDAYWSCSTACLHCAPSRFGGPGLWIEDGYCWGDIVEGTCGDTGNCGVQHRSSSLSCSPFAAPGVEAEPAAFVPVAVPSR